MNEQQKDVNKMTALELKGAIFDCQEMIRRNQAAIDFLVPHLNKRMEEEQSNIIPFNPPTEKEKPQAGEGVGKKTTKKQTKKVSRKK